MAGFRQRQPFGMNPFEKAMLTPGPLGHNDTASPETMNVLLRRTPGPLGMNDYASPDEPGRATSIPLATKQLRIMAPAQGSGDRLTDEDFRSAANTLGPNVSVAILRAFAEVESGGKSGFGPNGLPIIAYEGHIFRRLTRKKYDLSHPLLSYKYACKAGPEWKQNNRSQKASWSALALAMELDCDAALQACSWGMFQIMGFNFTSCGFTNVEGFVRAMKAGERGQLSAFVGYCKAKKGLVRALAETDFRTIATLYNGEDFGNYDQLIERSYRKHGGE